MREWIVTTVAIALLGCGAPELHHDAWSGPTMGAHFGVEAYCAAAVGELHDRVEAVLASVDVEMSTYRDDSILTSFNRSPPGVWFDVSPHFAEVVEAALSLSEHSDGAFDVTVYPLVELWGFGPVDDRKAPPSAEEIAEVLRRVGYRYLEVRIDPPALRKTRDVHLDLSAIAPGHAADRIGSVLEDAGCTSYLVDVGGEMLAHGRKPDGSRWRIGVERPDSERLGVVDRVVHVENAAVATSGDYRNWVEWNGLRYSHTFDPRRGTPVRHALASVTVVLPSDDRAGATMWADGFATLLNVLGPEQGPVFANDHGLSARFVMHAKDGFEVQMTGDFEQYLHPAPSGDGR